MLEENQNNQKMLVFIMVVQNPNPKQKDNQVETKEMKLLGR